MLTMRQTSIFALTAQKQDHGFSLVEMAIVFVLIAVMMIPLYSLLFNITKLRPDNERMEIIQEGLAEYLRVTGTFPCPAPLGLDMDNNDNAYRASCGGAIAVNGASGAANAVLIGAVPIDDIRAAVGCGDVATTGLASFSADVLGSVKDTMYSVREVFVDETSLNVRGKGETDGVGNAVKSDRIDDIRCPLKEYLANEDEHKFIYAVTEDATQIGFDIFNPGGVAEISVLNAAGLVATDENQIYVLIDTGSDGKGSYQRDGTLTGVACDPLEGIDAANCDYTDAIFVAAPLNADEQTTPANFYDDVIDFDISGFMSEQSFWQWGTDSGGNRNMILNNSARLVIDPIDPTNADTDHLPDADDALVVNRGRIYVEEDVMIKGAADSSTVNIEAADVANSERINTKNEVVSDRFCYPDGASLIANCNTP